VISFLSIAVGVLLGYGIGVSWGLPGKYGRNTRAMHAARYLAEGIVAELGEPRFTEGCSCVRCRTVTLLWALTGRNINDAPPPR
jgi:hypothetical protein